MIDDPRLPDRFWSKLVPEPNTGCWLWIATTRGGYGQLSLGSRTDKSVYMRTAHRVAYEALVGPVADGLVLDHLCRTRCCVNPAHLEPVTHAENVRRSPVVGLAELAKTHCPSGHLYDQANTYRAPSGSRHCRRCHRDRQKARRAS